MNIIVYGGSLSGELITDYLTYNGHSIICVIDKGTSYCKFSNLVVADIGQLPFEVLKDCEEIVVALGSNNEANIVQESIQSYLLKNDIKNCIVTTVHDQKYGWQYKKAYNLAMLEQKSVLGRKGYFLSRELQLPIDNNQSPLPWYTYACIDFLEKRLDSNSNWNVFEYGSGYSTLWWSTKVMKVVSVENDENWYKKVYLKKPENVQIHLQTEQNSYVSMIKSNDFRYEIICIDGAHRNQCTKEAISSLTDNGVIIFDNSDRTEDYKEAFQILRSNGFKEFEFIGIGTINDYEWQTSIFYRENNILNI